MGGPFTDKLRTLSVAATELASSTWRGEKKGDRAAALLGMAEAFVQAAKGIELLEAELVDAKSKAKRC